MREIKFRLWNDSNKKWDHPSILKIDNKGKIYYQRDGKFIISQYTGLKDKNGKEVYEGDIIEGSFLNSDYEIPCKDKGIIYFQEAYGGFSINFQKYNISISSMASISKYIIIGNIYENPELIEEEEVLNIMNWAASLKKVDE